MNLPRTILLAQPFAASVKTFLAAICILIAATRVLCLAGEIEAQRATLLNNDDHTTGDNPNKATYLSLTGEPQVDRILVVLDTGGTTEYDYTLIEPLPAKGVPEWHVELGFGTGDMFVSAATVFPQLDFDAPSPHRLPTAGTYQRVQPFGAHALNFSNGDYGGLKLTIDVPDLPTSLRNFYTPAELATLPAGATAFTLRSAIGFVVPEPAMSFLAAVCFVGLQLSPRVRRVAKRANG